MPEASSQLQFMTSPARLFGLTSARARKTNRPVQGAVLHHGGTGGAESWENFTSLGLLCLVERCQQLFGGSLHAFERFLALLLHFGDKRLPILNGRVGSGTRADALASGPHRRRGVLQGLRILAPSRLLARLDAKFRLERIETCRRIEGGAHGPLYSTHHAVAHAHHAGAHTHHAGAHPVAHERRAEAPRA